MIHSCLKNPVSKIAMGNAEEMLKQRADYVTSSNRHDGAAEAIGKIYLMKSWFYSWIRVQAADFLSPEP